MLGLGMWLWWKRTCRVEGAMRAQGRLALCISPGMPGTARIALVGALRRPDLKCGKRHSDHLDFRGGAEAATGVPRGDGDKD